MDVIESQDSLPDSIAIVQDTTLYVIRTSGGWCHLRSGRMIISFYSSILDNSFKFHLPNSMQHQKYKHYVKCWSCVFSRELNVHLSTISRLLCNFREFGSTSNRPHIHIPFVWRRVGERFSEVNIVNSGLWYGQA